MLALPATASAATVTVRPGGQYDEVHHVAAPGEANRVLVACAGDARSVTITDPGAVIAATAPCVAADAHTARCTRRPEATVEWIQSTRVELGDGADEVRTTRPGPAPIGGVIAFGGPGDDVLDGGAGSDALDGGATDLVHRPRRGRAAGAPPRGDPLHVRRRPRGLAAVLPAPLRPHAGHDPQLDLPLRVR